MKTCPPSIVVISFLFILAGGISIGVRVWQFSINKPTFLGEAGVYTSGGIAIAAGIYLMRGRNWARWLALAWLVFQCVISAFYQPLGLPVHLCFIGVLAWFLFRREAQQWFKPQPVAAPIAMPISIPPVLPVEPAATLPSSIPPQAEPTAALPPTAPPDPPAV
jgi:hypothetical protein